MALPYASAVSGRDALNDIRTTLQGFGCSRFAPLENFQTGQVTIQFEYRGRMVQVSASAKGYAEALMKQRKRPDRPTLWGEKDALKQGQIAVWSILRDWIKGQMMAIETGILPFDSAFLGQILLPDGRTIYQRVQEQGTLPALTYTPNS